ncbi:MAG: 7-carboxy-7-deazaguanine synthase [Zymomonas mobilis subsp. pomaceae]|uniref:7-carboxy-7-deazaguanine synthase n=1 Tax=Zymomonas mobilis subsp. pomaceae (strain ATCC 29192 / DSM 22645 / JCM 10191 / CCUG 17912 / NBRC 13757 / NCIMB 11200 / NRRL B-4491 / Barker I) TaxID=579138 RepID=F8ET53_ZYMMT|nr:7-carboxy-7-deazaguanine synthase [Zymomonas mobilis]AEI36943.1 conserved hypothetical protein, NrdG domain (organic radical activating enzymes) [Zymomonas mobilis subsp. pomaceae ATCC 29192]MDX5948316.1 7-carboxy-7-deazaguanine synthase [Zymomonas mobilis subsp. pomaceae]GEB89071.1 7-carboxy-7-deazaguanine synthase [Zymomonas mobilis subsp. pomaceae]
MSGSYAVKESFLTLQGEGAQAGRRAVFIRFSGCNLWNGLERDRMGAVCQFCDTDFVGLGGDGGGRFTASQLATHAKNLWRQGLCESASLPAPASRPFVVLTGGEPLLQVDTDLIQALKSHDFIIAVETNGTRPMIEGIDWVCMSPKAGAALALKKGNEIKLIWPQTDIDIEALESLDFTHYLIQPMDNDEARQNLEEAVAFVMQRPLWRLSLQTHKMIGLK